MTITAGMVKELREKTGVGMMKCKKALQEANGDLGTAEKLLRKQGEMAAAKKADRATGEGLVGSYIHTGGKIGVMLEINCETDFAARSDDFRALVKNIAMHVAATNPTCIDESGVPAETLENERRIETEKAQGSGKPAEIIEKMVSGRMNKYLKQITLVGQPFVKDPDISVGKLLSNAGATVTSFVRFEVGDGIEKKVENFADEVMKQIEDAKNKG